MEKDYTKLLLYFSTPPLMRSCWEPEFNQSRSIYTTERGKHDKTSLFVFFNPWRTGIKHLPEHKCKSSQQWRQQIALASTRFVVQGNCSPINSARRGFWNLAFSNQKGSLTVFQGLTATLFQRLRARQLYWTPMGVAAFRAHPAWFATAVMTAWEKYQSDLRAVVS